MGSVFWRNTLPERKSIQPVRDASPQSRHFLVLGPPPPPPALVTESPGSLPFAVGSRVICAGTGVNEGLPANKADMVAVHAALTPAAVPVKVALPCPGKKTPPLGK